MRVTYLTTDEVNRELSMRSAVREGLELAIRPVADDMGSTPSDATLYDLDHLAPQDRDVVIADLCSGSSSGLVAVHSYKLGDEEVAALESREVLVFRRFEPDLLRQLCRKAASRETSAAVVEGSECDMEDYDPTVIGGLVRSLARSAYRLLNQGGERKIETFEKEVHEVAAQLKELLHRLARLDGSTSRELKQWATSLDRLFEEHFASEEITC